MEISNISDAEFKILVIRMLKELRTSANIKKAQSETKDTLIDIKNNLQGNDRVDEAENQINDLEQKETKTTTQNKKKKKESKKMRTV